MNTKYVTASELGDYVYCECCWADKLEGTTQQTGEMLAGVAAHDRLQWLYTTVQFVRRVSIILVVGSLVLLVIAMILLYLTGNLL